MDPIAHRRARRRINHKDCSRSLQVSSLVSATSTWCNKSTSRLYLLTGCRIRSFGSVHTFSQDDSKAGLEVPINMTMEEPWTGIIGPETNRNVVPHLTNVNCIADDGVVVIVMSLTSTTDNVERMLHNDPKYTEVSKHCKPQVVMQLTPCR